MNDLRLANFQHVTNDQERLNRSCGDKSKPSVNKVSQLYGLNLSDTKQSRGTVRCQIEERVEAEKR